LFEHQAQLRSVDSRNRPPHRPVQMALRMHLVPADRDFPSSVWVDRDASVADEEIGYTFRNVQRA